jgi:hypothetical protein
MDVYRLWDAYEVVTRFQIGRRDVQVCLETYFVLDTASQQSPARFIKQTIRLQGSRLL